MDAKEQGDKLTAEEVKELVRRYADQEFPGWRVAGAFVAVGAFGEDDRETLLVSPITPSATPDPSLSQAGPGADSGNEPQNTQGVAS